MRNKMPKIIFGFLILSAAAWFLLPKLKNPEIEKETIREIRPVVSSIQSTFSTTGSVLPKNRLQVKPPVNGRIDDILVREGEKVKIGQTLAWMSSTERAAILDAAAGQGEQALKYWKEVYKPIPLISPINGEVIVATTQPGQAVTVSEAVIVLSDHLIVRAQVDETDIGKVMLGQNAVVSIDAYQDTKIKVVVEHIYYESRTVNNVTIYDVDLIPEEIPGFFRSGMNATVNFIEKSRENILLIPLGAVHREKDEDYVFVKQNSDKEPVKQSVKLGISDDKDVEVVSGISAGDVIIIKSKKYALPKSDLGTNPFLPFGRRRAAQH